MELDEALDRLYAAPLEEFTATRNALAKELGSEGAQIKSLKKPNLAAWALNQLARGHPDKLGELYEVTDRVRNAQRRVMSGGKASALRDATDERGRIVSDLTNLAGTILTESGHSAAPSTLAAVTGSLLAIATSRQDADLLRAGRLTRELRAESMMDVGGGLTLVEDEAAEAEEPEEGTDVIRAAREAVNEARDRVRDARKSLKEAEADVSRRVSEADEAERAAKGAREAAEFARRAAEARRNELEEAERVLEERQVSLRSSDS